MISAQFEHELSLPSDMLFCLHHQLHQAHRNEWPQIEQLVISQGQFRLLGPVCKLANPVCGESLLEYLYSADHNMVHFACHCRQQSAGEDELLVSLINEQNIEDNPKIIELGTYTFVDIKGHFHRKPLVFLNACQSAGGSDELRSTFNLPRAFVKRSAAAVVATACPVPDKFAAAFARQFYKYFMRGKEIEDPKTGKKTQRFASIGEALLETRQYFLKTHNNPLGLAYGLYSPAHYRLARPPFEGGTA